jgi:uncharacterized protein YcbX
MPTPEAVGRITRLWRYPVKSMLGERCRQLALDTRGVCEDRGMAVRTADGGLGSGKNARRHRRIDGLFDFHAHGTGDDLQIRFPDGSRMHVNDPRLDTALSSTLGQPLTLRAEAEVRHLDDSPVHILTTSAIHHLQARLPDLHIDPRRFRPNLVIDEAAAGLPEFDWIGRTLHIGDEVMLRVTKPTERCRMTTLAQDDLPNEPLILRGIARHMDLHFGVYAEVLHEGHIACGDIVRIHD